MTYGKANASRKAIPRKEGICWGGVIVERGRALKMHLGHQSANISSGASLRKTVFVPYLLRVLC